ncbi:MAG: class I SAM-dependent methyltransferase [Myxococcota bacterium]
MASDIEDRVRAQYEQFPYPRRTPEEDAKRSTGTLASLENLALVQHFGFGGRTPDRPLRVLVAGGGTGDATVQLGRQVRELPHGGEIVHLDLSEASIAIALERVERFGLTNVQARQGSLLEAHPGDLGRFDYINCSGVLHHLPDPWAGVRALRRLLTNDGVMGVMVYGEHGRHAVYPVQQLLRRLTEPYSLPEQVAIARRVLPQLPGPHPLKGNVLGYHPSMTDAELVDRFLHPCDRAFTVPQVLDWMNDTAMRVVDFVPSLRYAASQLAADPFIVAEISRMAPFERYAMAELWSFRMDRHKFFAVRDDNAIVPLQPRPDVVPVLREASAVIAQLGRTPRLAIRIGQAELEVPVAATPAHLSLLEAIDGRRTLAALAAELEVEIGSLLPVFVELYGPLNGIELMTLAQPGSPSY